MSELRQYTLARLRETETGLPLSDVVVQVLNLDGDSQNPVEIDRQVTDHDGLVPVAYPAEPGSASQGRLRLVARTRADVEFWSRDVDVPPLDGAMLTFDVSAPPDEAEPQTHDLTEVIEATDLQVSYDLASYLRDKGIRSLADIRRLGGLANDDDLPVPSDDPSVVALDAHADLGAVSSDIASNSALIKAGYGSVAEIAAAPMPDFFAAAHDTLGDFRAARLHTVAGARTSVLKSILASLAVGKAHGLSSENSPTIYETSSSAPDPLPSTCGCEDCEAAVSPAAYLADLLAYAATHLKSAGVKTDLGFLEAALHQPFGRLPTDCPSVDGQTHQVRLAVEVLRSYLAEHPPAAAQEGPLLMATRQYLQDTYELLLAQLGTSCDEIRVARTAPAPERRALAERIGISLRDVRPDPLTTEGDELDRLCLSAESTTDSAHLTEQALERLFGLVDTCRDPLTDGRRSGDTDAYSDLSAWRFQGVRWGVNTDVQGAVHLRLSLNPPFSTVGVFRDSARTEMVAVGTTFAYGTGLRRVRLLPRNGSGLSGAVSVSGYSGGYLGDNQFSVALVPDLLVWRLAHLRSGWQAQDWTADAYSPVSTGADTLPVVDPDVISPDDFRRPDPSRPAFALWTTRRKWVDDRLAAMSAATTTVVVDARPITVPDAEAALAAMYQPVEYAGTPRVPWLATTPVDQLDVLGDRLDNGSPAEAAQAGDRLRDDLLMQADDFRQLLRIRHKARAWAADPRFERVSPREWTVFFSLLVQAQKQRFRNVWVEEERTGAVQLGPAEFWCARREPKEGAWPPDRVAGHPLIDPDETRLADLPEPPLGADAAALWQDRRSELATAITVIQEARETGGFDMMMRAALGHPHAGDPLQQSLDSLDAGLADDDPEVADATALTVEQKLRLSVDDFRRVLALRDRDLAPAAEAPTTAEWAELYALLTTAHKRKHLHQAWADEETRAGLTAAYWRAVKARLPYARTSTEARLAWTDALRRRSAPPVIDPDLVDVGMFRGSGVKEALAIWHERQTWTDGMLATLAAGPRTLSGFDATVGDVLLVPATELTALHDRHERGEAIEDRLDQLSLGRAAFTFLVKIRKVLLAGQPVAEGEWANICSILIRVAKVRRSAEWRERERLAGVTLSPDIFTVTDPRTPTPATSPPLAWRVDIRERFDWFDQLRLREEQEQSVLAAFHDTVDAVEEATLPTLRDALTAAAGAGDSLAAQASWVTDRLFIDARAGGCQKTTRIAQAIETLQGILFAARTGHQALKALELSLPATDFDTEWRWLGSYATWRSAMFVCLYPENIAVGQLRRHQTPAFRELVKAVRTNRRLTPALACELAAQYEAYYEDIARLTLGATASATVQVRTGTPCAPGQISRRPVVFIFGTGGVSGQQYWSVFDVAEEPSGYAQSFWETVPGAPLGTVVGADVYERAPTDRKLFLFIRTPEHKLQFLTRNLETGVWSPSADLVLPAGDARWTDVVIDQNTWLGHPPRLAVRDGFGFYIRALNQEGTAWEDGDWKKFRLDAKEWNFSGERSLLAATEGALWVRTDDFLTFRRKYTYVHPDVRNRHGRYIGAVMWGKSKGDVWGHLVQRRTNGDIDDWGAPGPSTWIGSDFELTGLHSIVPNCEFVDHTAFAYKRQNPYGDHVPDDLIVALDEPAERDGLYLRLVTLEPWLTDAPIVSSTHLIAPRAASYLPGQFSIPARLDETAAATRRNTVKIALSLMSDSATNRAVGEEAYFFVPMLLSEALRRSGEYGAALDFARTVYDYTAPVGQRKIYHGLVEEESLPSAFKRSDDWLRDPLDPHAVASTRRHSYTRFTLQAIVRTLLDYADEEFTRDTAEAVPRARSLYTTALSVLDLPDLGQSLGSCDDVIGKINIGLDGSAPPWAPLTLRELSAQLGDIKDLRTLSTTVVKVRQALRSDAPWAQRIDHAQRLVNEAVGSEIPRFCVADTLKRKKDTDARALSLLLASPRTARIADEAGEAAGTRYRDRVAQAVGVSTTVLEAAKTPLPWLSHTAAPTASSGDVAFTPQLWPVTAHGKGATAGLLRPVLGPPTDGDPQGAGSPIEVRGLLNTPLPRRTWRWLWRRPANPLLLVPYYFVLLLLLLWHVLVSLFTPRRPNTDDVGTENDGSPADLQHLWPDPVPPQAIVNFPPAPSAAFCVPPNPLLASLRLHAELDLHKISNCRNIAGLKRALEPYAAPTDTVTGLPTIGADGQLMAPGGNGVRPTLYRYGTLVQRAKELLANAQQIEAAMLSAIEKQDAEAYSMLRARQDLELSQASIQVENLQLQQAKDSVTLANLQQTKAQLQTDHYQKLLDDGLLELENTALSQMQEQVSYLGTAADFAFASAAVQGAPIAAGALMGAGTGMATGGPVGAVGGAVGGALAGVAMMGPGGIASALTAVSSGYSSLAGEYNALAQIKLTAASFERRRQEWDLALALARQDVAIGGQQVTIANDMVEIAKQEKLIAETRGQHAQDTVAFLANKFTNAELYDWMSDVLEDVYSGLLRQATAMARLAENQLAFERQEPAPAFIQNDYWQAPNEGFASGDLEGTAVDRRGLTGTARLLQDLYRLDQYAFASDQRKLQLSKTFSLALTAPIEFQRFRESGVLTFATPMRAFDDDFPGHYLRLIKNVRVSLVSLLPPTHGIHAELSTTGLSRVVTGPDVFRTLPIRRDPEILAMSAPIGASGVLGMETHPTDMLVPFEGTGVDTVWELRMPKAANVPVDYRVIADVLFAVDYTALPSRDYGRQVTERLAGPRGAELPVSFRTQLQDQWYELHNPDQSPQPMVVRFRVGPEDFPPNLKALKIQHMALRFGHGEGAAFDIPVTLRLTPLGSPAATGGTARPTDDVISTRRGNAGSWAAAFTGKNPVGEWELSVPDTEAVRRRFASGELEDILLVVSYSGYPPEWPR